MSEVVTLPFLVQNEARRRNLRVLVDPFRDYVLSRANKSWYNKHGAAIVSHTEATRSSPAGHPPVSTLVPGQAPPSARRYREGIMACTAG